MMYVRLSWVSYVAKSDKAAIFNHKMCNVSDRIPIQSSKLPVKQIRKSSKAHASLTPVLPPLGDCIVRPGGCVRTDWTCASYTKNDIATNVTLHVVVRKQQHRYLEPKTKEEKGRSQPQDGRRTRVICSRCACNRRRGGGGSFDGGTGQEEQ